MSASVVRLERRVQRPLERYQPSREDLLETLADAREAIRERDIAILMLCLMRARPCPRDVAAERRVLGALVCGRATLEDVLGLEASDFAEYELFVAIRAQLVAERRRPLVPRPAARRDAARRAHETVLLRRRCVEERLVARVHARTVEALYSLPWPAGCPRDEIAVVGGLGRWRRQGS